MPVIKGVYVPEPGHNSPPKVEGGSPRDEVKQALDSSLSSMAKQFEYETLRSNLERLQSGHTPQDQKDSMALGKFLLELVESEREARQAAEKSRTVAEQERWKVEADRLHGMGEEIKAIARQDNKADPFATVAGFLTVLTQFDKWKGNQSAGLPKDVMAGADGPTLITLQQMKQAHEEKMEELRLQREQGSQQFQQTLQVQLQQMKQSHDIAMEESRDRRDQMKIQMAALQQKEGQRNNQWREALETIGGGIQEMITGNGSGVGAGADAVPRPIARTKASKLPVYHCESCGADVPISPEVEKMGRFTCGSCGEQYELEKGQSNGAGQPAEGHTEEPGS